MKKQGIKHCWNKKTGFFICILLKHRKKKIKRYEKNNNELNICRKNNLRDKTSENPSNK